VKTSRREWLRSVMRLGAGAALISGGALLAMRPSGRCTLAQACADCAALGTCHLPEARLFRDRLEKDGSSHERR